MQEKNLANIPKGENIITLQGMEEEGSTARNMWHNLVYRQSRLRRNSEYEISVF